MTRLNTTTNSNPMKTIEQEAHEYAEALARINSAMSSTMRLRASEIVDDVRNLVAENKRLTELIQSATTQHPIL